MRDNKNLLICKNNVNLLSSLFTSIIRVIIASPLRVHLSSSWDSAVVGGAPHNIPFILAVRWSASSPNINPPQHLLPVQSVSSEFSVSTTTLDTSPQWLHTTYKLLLHHCVISGLRCIENFETKLNSVENWPLKHQVGFVKFLNEKFKDHLPFTNNLK